MASIETLRKFVDLALPKPCEFGEENFAGDPLPKAFCDLLRKRHKVDFQVFVSWACPPNVLLVRSSAGNAVIRSERLDTLLVEYFHLRRLHGVWSGDLTRDVAAAGILRWMCELLIGFRQPELAIHAYTRRPNINGIDLTSPFRDETLESLPELERAALQCFSLGHEIGHLLIAKQENATLDARVDGVSLAEHALTQEQMEGVLGLDQMAGFASVREREIDAPNLLNEVEVDLFALYSVVDFLLETFCCSIERAIDATMMAFEGQSFVYGSKGTCHLLSLAEKGELGEGEFALRDYLIGVEISIRVRAVARRAGIVWAVAEHPEHIEGNPDFNNYVKKVDNLISQNLEFVMLMGNVLGTETDSLHRILEENYDAASEVWLESMLAAVENDRQLRSELYYILTAFGCSGAVDVISYLREIRRTWQRVS